MRVVLRDDVEGVGRRGDIVEVAGGFARNYLLPHGQAIVATDGIESQAASMRRARDLRAAADLEAAEAKAQVLAGSTVTITARAGSTGRLFGSVSAAEVVEAVAAQKGVELDRHAVALDEPIKEVGSHGVRVDLHEGLSTELTVEVVAAG